MAFEDGCSWWSRALRCGLGVLLASSIQLAHGQDVVKLRDGREFEGRVIVDGKERVVLLVESREREFASAEVAEVHSLARSQAQALERVQRLDPRDAAGVLDVARFCRSAKLEGEAVLFALTALSVDPRFAPAHEFLGHELRGAKWRVKHKSGWALYDELLVERLEFNHAWRLPTLHFALRTNLPLDQACAAALELELGHLAFTRWLGERVELQEVVDPIGVQLHRDKASYPGGDGRTGYFSPELNTAFLNAEPGFAPGSLLHEATHGVVASTALRTRKGLGSIPPWLNEALADMAGYARSGALGRPAFDFTCKVPLYFQTHARAREPLGLERVIALSAREFVQGRNIELAYAQSHTLLKFGLQGGDGEHAEQMWAYVRSCYAGHSSITDFKALFGADLGKFERAWLEFARKGG